MAEILEWLSPRQVSEKYGVPIETLSYWRKQQYGPVGARLGARVKYRASDWEAFMALQSMKAAQLL